MSHPRYQSGMAQENSIVEQLRAAIAESELSRFQIAKRAGLPYSVLHGFAGEYRGLNFESAAALCKALGLTLRPMAKPKRRKVGE